MKTKLIRYNIDLKSPGGYNRWKELTERLLATNGDCFNVYADTRPDAVEVPEGEVEFELAYIFSNQWNTTSGFRVFDWYEGIVPNPSIKRGYYLEITDEMREVRRNTNSCGYCGHQEAAQRGLVFCDRCLDSPYLKAEELHLLRMLPVALHFPTRDPLTDAEREHLMPEYVRRQTTGADSRNAQKLAKQRRDIRQKFEKKTENAKAEHDGLIWLMDRGFDVDNVIYYDHVGRFAFGWRSPVSDEVAQKLLEVVSEFPFPYEIKGVSRSWESH